MRHNHLAWLEQSLFFVLVISGDKGLTLSRFPVLSLPVHHLLRVSGQWVDRLLLHRQYCLFSSNFRSWRYLKSRQVLFEFSVSLDLSLNLVGIAWNCLLHESPVHPFGAVDGLHHLFLDIARKFSGQLWEDDFEWVWLRTAVWFDSLLRDKWFLINFSAVLVRQIHELAHCHSLLKTWLEKPTYLEVVNRGIPWWGSIWSFAFHSVEVWSLRTMHRFLVLQLFFSLKNVLVRLVHVNCLLSHYLKPATPLGGHRRLNWQALNCVVLGLISSRSVAVLDVKTTKLDLDVWRVVKLWAILISRHAFRVSQLIACLRWVIHGHWTVVSRHESLILFILALLLLLAWFLIEPLAGFVCLADQLLNAYKVCLLLVYPLSSFKHAWRWL